MKKILMSLLFISPVVCMDLDIPRQTDRDKFIQLLNLMTENNLDAFTKELQKSNFDVNYKHKNEGNRTLLHFAAHLGRDQFANVLIKHNVDLDPEDSDMLTPITIAIAKNHDGIVKMLIENGSKYANYCHDHKLAALKTFVQLYGQIFTDSNVMNILHSTIRAVSRNPQEFIKEQNRIRNSLMNVRITDIEKDLIQDCLSKKLKYDHALLELHKKITEKAQDFTLEEINTVSSNGITPIMMAVMFNNNWALEKFLAAQKQDYFLWMRSGPCYKADVSAMNANEENALMIAKKHNNNRAIESLQKFLEPIIKAIKESNAVSMPLRLIILDYYIGLSNL